MNKGFRREKANIYYDNYKKEKRDFMQIFVQVKQLGKRRDTVKKQPFNLANIPYTTRELFDEIVHTTVDTFNQHVDNSIKQNSEDNSSLILLKYLSPNDINIMESGGKISFDVDYRQEKADLITAQKNVYSAFEDGLFRVFLNDTELTSLDSPIIIKENDTLIFIRLIMLAGRMW